MPNIYLVNEWGLDSTAFKIEEDAIEYAKQHNNAPVKLISIDLMAIYRLFLREFRHVKTICSKCGGSGFRVYESTSIWEGGVGGSAITEGICDYCWGTGDENRHGVNLKEIVKNREQRPVIDMDA